MAYSLLNLTLIKLAAATCICMALLAVEAKGQEDRTVAGQFDFGIVGRQGKNPGKLDDIYNFSTLGLKITYFAFDQAGFDGTQGNDIPGFLRMITHDGQFINISGSINWQIKRNGRTIYIGIMPDNFNSGRTISTPFGSYTLDGGTNFAVRLPGQTLSFSDGGKAKGSADPPDLSGIPTLTVESKSGPPHISDKEYFRVLEGQTKIATLEANEWVTWAFTGGDDSALLDIDHVTGEVYFRSPPSYENPSDDDGDNRYHVEVSTWDVDGESTTKEIVVHVVPIPPDITSTKSVSAAFALGQAFDCALDPASPEAGIIAPGTCITYRIDIQNSANAGFAEKLKITDQMPDNISAVSVLSSQGFDDATLADNAFIGTITRFDPGATAHVEIRAYVE